MGFEKQVLQGIKILSQFIKPWRHMCFMLVGYNTSFEEDMYRFKKLNELGIKPYVMIYNQKADRKLQCFAGWVNGRYHTVCNWDKYEPWVKAQSQISLIG
jgi:hypothetical protein